MNVFVIEGQQGKVMVMESLMNDFPGGNYTAEKDNCAFIINDRLTLFPRRSFNLGWNEDTDTKKMAKTIYDTAIAYGFKNIFIYTNEPKNGILAAELIYSFKTHTVPNDFQKNNGWGNVFIFCQPSR